MQLNKDISSALQLLDEIEECIVKSVPSQDESRSQGDLQILRSVLENPVFRSIVTIQDSLDTLQETFTEDPTMTADDFDITHNGDLLLIDTEAESIYKEISDDEVKDSSNCDKQNSFGRRRSIEDITFKFYKDYSLSSQYNRPRRSISLLEGGQDIPMQDISDLSRIISNTSRLKSRSLNAVPQHFGQQNQASVSFITSGNVGLRNHEKTEYNHLYPAENHHIFRESIPDTAGNHKWAVPKEKPKKRKEKSHSLDTIIDFALWDREVQLIVLRKTDKGLGFSICEHRDKTDPTKTAIVIKNLVPNGMAKIDGRLMPGDRIMLVNDIIFENISLEAAARVLKGISNGLVRIGVVKLLTHPEADH